MVLVEVAEESVVAVYVEGVEAVGLWKARRGGLGLPVPDTSKDRDRCVGLGGRGDVCEIEDGTYCDVSWSPRRCGEDGVEVWIWGEPDGG